MRKSISNCLYISNFTKLLSMRLKFLSSLLLILVISFSSCRKKGCTDPVALNYAAEAKKDDGTCKYASEPTITTVKRVVYGADERQHADVYFPTNHNNTTKTVILIHGGGWVLGPKASDSVTTFNGGLGWNLVTPLLEAGFAVAVMKYRLACYTSQSTALSGDANFYLNDMLVDIDLLIDKLKIDATGLGISSSEFALIGESAGAHLALMYSLRNTSDTDVKTVISFYSPANLDESAFKNATASAPFNSLALSNAFGVEKYSNSCKFSANGTVNLFWCLKSFVGYDLSLSAAAPGFTDTLSPSYLPNIQRNLPVFIMHGETDVLVPPAHADSLIAAITTKFSTIPAVLSDFSAQHKMKKYANLGHGWSGSGNKSLLYADVISWLAAHF